HLFRKYQAKNFFNEYCKDELKREWHVHIDNYSNYMPGYCGGISLGDAKYLDSISQINLDEKPILDALVTNIGRLHEFGVKEFEYKDLSEGYISKCHLCVDIRKHIAKKTDKFKELRPIEFYYHL
ncbi:MAG: hypothetical protein AB1779_07565, partial [Candidatus Thermoplasmatota archaeon]